MSKKAIILKKMMLSLCCLENRGLDIARALNDIHATIVHPVVTGPADPDPKIPILLTKIAQLETELSVEIQQKEAFHKQADGFYKRMNEAIERGNNFKAGTAKLQKELTVAGNELSEARNSIRELKLDVIRLTPSIKVPKTTGKGVEVKDKKVVKGPAFTKANNVKG